MNKDLEGFLQFDVHFSGCGLATSTACFHVVKEPPKMVLRRMIGPSLETGAVLDAVLSVNYCAIAIGVL